MNTTDYTKFDFEDFAQDEYFRKWVIDRDRWGSRGVITTFEMRDGPVKNRILFCQESQHPQRMRHHS